MISVLLVDDHDLVRTGIRRVIEDTEDITVIGEARTGEEAIEIIKRTDPDVVLMDVNMPGMGGVEATRRILGRHPHVSVIGVSMHTDGLFPKRLMACGADGYLTKGCEMDEFLLAIRTVANGKKYIGREAAQSLALSAISGSGLPFDELSKRELQVMRMIAQGHTNQAISNSLNLSSKTVSTYRTRLYKKLGVESDVELAHLAMRHGIIDAGMADLKQH